MTDPANVIHVAVLKDCDVRLVWFTPDMPYFVFVDVCKALGLPASSAVLRSLPIDTTGLIKEDSALVKAAYVTVKERALVSAAGLAHLFGAAERNHRTHDHQWKPQTHPHYQGVKAVTPIEDAGGNYRIFEVAA